MITIDSFKKHFYRDFPYLPIWVSGKAYFIGDVVYSEPNFYECTKDGIYPLTDTNAWKLVKEDITNYLQDFDIQKAMTEANLNINKSLFDCPTLDLVSFYLTAFYLVLDIKNATSGFSSNAYSGYVASKSVGNVSESYAIPAWVSNDPLLGIYMDNGYGKKYLTYLLPRLRANSILLCSGGITP